MSGRRESDSVMGLRQRAGRQPELVAVLESTRVLKVGRRDAEGERVSALGALLVEVRRELTEQGEKRNDHDCHCDNDFNQSDAVVALVARGPIPNDYSEWGPHG